MHFGLEEPDAALLQFGKNADPEGVLMRSQEFFVAEEYSNAAALCQCLLKRKKSIGPAVHAGALIMQSRLFIIALQFEQAKSAAEEALALAVKHLGEVSPEFLEAREILTDMKPDQAQEIDRIYDVFDSVGVKIEKLSEKENIDYSDAIEIYLKKAPEAVRVVFVLAEYLGSVSNDGFESFLLDRPKAELNAAAKYLKLIGAKTETALFQSVCKAYENGADLEDFDEQFKEKNLLRLLSNYLEKHSSEIDAFLQQ